jgi:hypothetical protein
MRRGPNKPNWPFTLNRGYAQQASGLLAWWPGALVGSKFHLDLSGHSLGCNLLNFAWTTASGWTNGVDGGRGALIFDGVDDRCEVLSSMFYFTAAQPFTLAFWTRIIAQPSNSVGWMAGVRVVSTGNGYYLYWEKASSKFIWGYQGLNNLHHYRYSSALSLGVNYHVTCTRDSSNTMAGTKIYINGVNDSSLTDDTGTPSDFSPISSPSFCFGNDTQNQTFPSNCMIDDMCVYTRCLSANDVWSLYDPKTRWLKRWQPSRTARLFNSSGNLPEIIVPPISVQYHAQKRRRKVISY